LEPYVVLARRYRPGTFDEVLGQEAVSRTLVHAIETGRVAHAYLFAGPRGIGKTSMARILAKALCCEAHEEPTPNPCGTCELCAAAAKGEDLDVIEIDGASNRGINEVRDLRDNARYTPARARYKMYIIDEVHMLTTEAFNALLKILEEPPPHVKFIFATTEPQNVPATILSRCQRFDFRRIPTRTIANHLRTICEREDVTADDDALMAVARAATGGMRDAQSLLDQLITLGGGEIRTADLTSLLGTVSGARMERLFQAIADGDDATVVRVYEEVFDDGIDPAEFLKQAIAAVRDLLVLLATGEDTDLVDMTPESKVAMAKIAAAWGKPRVMYALGLLAETIKTVKATGEGRALVTLALVKLAKAGRFRSLDSVLKDLSELERRLEGSPSTPTRRAPAPTPRAPEKPEVSEGNRALFGDTSVPADGAKRGEETVGLTLDGLRSVWDEIVSRITTESSAVGSFLSSGKVVSLRDDGVVVGFPPSARFHRRQLSDPDRIHLIEREIAEVAGVALRLTTEDLPEEESDEEPTEEETRGASREDYEQVGRAPISGALKDVLGARLIHVERS
jgi:DNA polymerase-3 subunit gamma/tau